MNAEARQAAREILAENMAAALADPDVHEHAKSLAGYVLRRLQKQDTDRAGKWDDSALPDDDDLRQNC